MYEQKRVIYDIKTVYKWEADGTLRLIIIIKISVRTDKKSFRRDRLS